MEFYAKPNKPEHPKDDNAYQNETFAIAPRVTAADVLGAGGFCCAHIGKLRTRTGTQRI